MKKGWEKALAAKVAVEKRAQILNNMTPLLQERAARAAAGKESRWYWLWKPAGGLALAGALAAAVFVLVTNREVAVPQDQLEARLSPEMILRAEMLLDLKIIERWNPGVENGKPKKWPKKKT